MYKFIVFDLDGTLVNSLYDLGNSVNKGLEKIGMTQYPMDAYKKFVGNGREKLIERAMKENYSDEEKREIVRLTFDEEYAIHSNDNTDSYPGCAELLERLAKSQIKTAVLSNKPDEFVSKILKKVYPNHSFTEAWGQKPCYKCKPDGESLNAMLEKYNIKKSECLYVGDSDVDVLTAKNAGVTMIGVEWGFRGRQELLNAGADFVVSDAMEIFNIATKEL